MVAILEIKFCSSCGSSVDYRFPDDDNRERYICSQCQLIHYQNPKIVVCAIPAWEDKVLMCRRAIEPRYGLWTLPGGFMENGESVAEAAARETLEEANARVQVGRFFSMYSLPYISQVHMFYCARLLDLDFSAGEESLETVLFSEADIPWDHIAFRPVRYSLQHYFADRAAGREQVYTDQLDPPAHAVVK